MKIQTREIIHDFSKVIVIFTTEFGESRAYWEGDEPIKNHEYDVEVDIHDVLEWGNDITKNVGEVYSIGFKDNRVYITGILESADDDGYSVLRIGDFIIPFMAKGDSFPVNTSILLMVNTICLTPFYSC